LVPSASAYGFADRIWGQVRDAAGQEGGQVQLLPGRQVLADDDGDFGFEGGLTGHHQQR